MVYYLYIVQKYYNNMFVKEDVTLDAKYFLCK